MDDKDTFYPSGKTYSLFFILIYVRFPAWREMKRLL